MNKSDKNLIRIQSTLLNALIEVDLICRENNIAYWLDFGTLLGAVRHNGFIPWDDDVDITMPRESAQRFAAIVQNKLSSNLYFENKSLDQTTRCLAPGFRIRNTDYDIIRKSGKRERGVFLDVFLVNSFSSNKINLFFVKIKKRIFNIFWRLNSVEDSKKKYNFLLKTIAYSSKIRLFKKYVIWIKRVESQRSSRKISALNLIANSKKNKNSLISFDYDSNIRKYLTFFCIREIYPLREMTFEGHSFFVPNDWDSVLRSYFGEYMIPPAENERHGHIMKILERYD